MHLEHICVCKETNLILELGIVSHEQAIILLADISKSQLVSSDSFQLHILKTTS